MAFSNLLESNANGCRKRFAPLSRFAAAPEHRCYGFHPVATKTGRFSNRLTQLVEGSTTTAARWE
jgi:hypothetical protein